MLILVIINGKIFYDGANLWLDVLTVLGLYLMRGITSKQACRATLDRNVFKAMFRASNIRAIRN